MYWLMAYIGTSRLLISRHGTGIRQRQCLLQVPRPAGLIEALGQLSGVAALRVVGITLMPSLRTLSFPQGYILYSMRKKLKPELVGRSQEEVKQLRLSGQEVTDTYQVRRLQLSPNCLMVSCPTIVWHHASMVSWQHLYGVMRMASWQAAQHNCMCCQSGGRDFSL
jgi:hypothetical protein